MKLRPVPGAPAWIQIDEDEDALRLDVKTCLRDLKLEDTPENREIIWRLAAAWVREARRNTNKHSPTEAPDRLR
jgi:hypothetical protein